VYARLHYAFERTQKTLRTVLAIKDEYEVIQAFALIVAGFGAFRSAIDRDSHNIIVSCLTGCLLGTLFFLFVVGLITVIGALFVFTYNFAASEKIGFNSPKISRWRRVSTIVLSATLSGIAGAAVLQLFYEGTKRVVLVTQNASLP
jgi:O-antigen/teichoic acid export membrane protein